MSDVAVGLRDAYACIAELWCSPQDVDMVEVKSRAKKVGACLEGMDKESAASLSQFLRGSVTEEEYVELLELDPRCYLYLGSYV